MALIGTLVNTNFIWNVTFWGNSCQKIPGTIWYLKTLLRGGLDDIIRMLSKFKTDTRMWFYVQKLAEIWNVLWKDAQCYISSRQGLTLPCMRANKQTKSIFNPGSPLDESATRLEGCHQRKYHMYLSRPYVLTLSPLHLLLSTFRNNTTLDRPLISCSMVILMLLYLKSR